MSTFEDTEKRKISLVGDIAKCYMLLNYAYNNADETKLYSDEFVKRFTNFYKTIILLEETIDFKHCKEIAVELKKYFNIGFYRSKMEFLDDIDLGDELAEINQNVDSDYASKCSLLAVRLNFYHHNKFEFGSYTRKHVNMDSYEPINCSINNEEEEMYLFSQLADFFKSKYVDKTGKKLILEDM